MEKTEQSLIGLMIRYSKKTKFKPLEDNPIGMVLSKAHHSEALSRYYIVEWYLSDGTIKTTTLYDNDIKRYRRSYLIWRKNKCP